MVYFDIDLTLREKMNEYTRDDLKCWAEIFGKTGLSKLKKAELVELVLNEFLDPDVMFYRMAIYGDDEIEVFEKGFNGPYRPNCKEQNICCIFNEVEYGILSKDGEFLVPADVRLLWKAVRNDKFETYRHRASWVWRCLDWCLNMYGFFLKSDLLNVINSRTGFEMKKEELIEIIDHFPNEQAWFDEYGEQIVDVTYVDNEDALEELIDAQMGKECYIPTVAEVDEFYLEGGIISGKAYQNMRKFLINELYMSEEEVGDILYDTWDSLNTYDDSNETMQWFFEQAGPISQEQIPVIVPLYMAMSNETRRISNRGYSPDELSDRWKTEDGKKPTIVAGSSIAAQMLAYAETEINNMGFKLDLESNAITVPVMKFDHGIKGPAKVSEKKIYPNDPCPCGSGLKYKHCCGKKN